MSARLVSVIAAGHSGSTLLDMVVGSIPGAFSAGEVTHLPWQIYRNERAGPSASLQKLCSCGNGFKECPVWSRVLSGIGQERGFDIYSDPFRFSISLFQEDKFTYRPSVAHRVGRVLYHASFRYRGLEFMGSLFRKLLRKKTDNNWLLFDTVSEVTNKQFIVDSSKCEFRASLLQARCPDRVYFIVLIRDIRGVAYSDKKLGGNPVRRARMWVRQYNRIYDVISRIPNSKILCVRYEDLISDPKGTRLRVADFMGVTLTDLEFEINTKDYHLVAGNGMRHKGRITIRLDAAWRDGLTSGEQEQISKIDLGLNPSWKEFHGYG